MNDPLFQQNVKNIQTSLLSYVIHGNCTEELYCLYVWILNAFYDLKSINDMLTSKKIQKKLYYHLVVR